MSITLKISSQIKNFSPGIPFTYQQLGIESSQYLAAAKAIERFIKSGRIIRLSKGVFFKPIETEFGNLMPEENEILKPYLFKDGKRLAYVTGTSIYRKMGLTTQIPVIIAIASRSRKISLRLPTFSTKPVRSYVDVNNENYKLLQILDAIKDINKSPDLQSERAVKILSAQLGSLQNTDLQLLIEFALAYPPRVRALLGALLQNIAPSVNLRILKTSLNPLSTYNISLAESDLPYGSEWNIR